MFSEAKRGKPRKTYKFLINWFKLIKFFLVCLHSVCDCSLKWHNQSYASKVELNSNTTRTKQFFKFITTLFISCACTIAFSGITLLIPSPAIASPLLTITPISWNVIGLDSNNVNVGPNTYMTGARVCNIGSTVATNVKATFKRDGATNIYINLQGSDTLSVPSLPFGAPPPSQYTIRTTPTNCADFYYNVVITRNSAAYRTTQRYYIEATADGVGVIRTPTPRELYVERLISQNRNAVSSISGPTSVTVGQTYQYTVTGKTATQGYEQLVFSPDFPNTIFQVVSVSTTYSSPSGAVNSTIYADACGWENDPTSTYYHNNLTCSNPAIPDNYSSSKAGGNPITTTYTVKILSAGSANVTNVIYDFSGSSYHYNSDYGSGANIISISAQNPSTTPNLEISKTHTGNFTVNRNGEYTLAVRNVGQTGTITPITVTDPLPTGLTYVSAAGNDWNCSYNSTNRTVTCTSKIGFTLAPSQSSTITLTVTAPATPTTVTNTATVTNTGDLNTSDNTATDPTIVNAVADISVTKTDNLNIINPGSAITYNIVVTNKSTSPNLTGITVDDFVPSEITGVTWTCTTSTTSGGSANSCSAASGSGNDISATVNLRSGVSANFVVRGTVDTTATGVLSNTVGVGVPSNFTDINPLDNTQTDNTDIFGPPTIRLVKRITAINPTNGTNTTVFVDDPSTTDDNDPNWPSDYLQGAVNGGAVKPGDTVEYTIYFLSSGGSNAVNSRLCDLLPANTSFVPDAFAVGKGIKYALGSTTLTDLTNVSDGDQGRFYASTETAPPVCRVGSNVNGTVLTNLSGAVVVELGTITKATTPGTANSYGFVRFRVTIN